VCEGSAEWDWLRESKEFCDLPKVGGLLGAVVSGALGVPDVRYGVHTSTYRTT